MSTVSLEAEPAQDDEPPEYPHWSGSFNLGSSLKRGNSDEASVTATFDAERRTEMTRWTNSLFFNYEDDSDGDISERKQRAFSQYDYFLSERLFAYGQGLAETDFSADLTYRWFLAAGLGYQFYDEEDWKWNGRAGLGFRKEKFEPSSGTDISQNWSATVQSDLEYGISESARFMQTVAWAPSLEDTNEFLLRARNRLEMNITDKLIGAFEYLYERDNNPGPGTEKDDHTVFATLGWTFGD